MAKYHLKENGDPARCRAELRACPRGGEADHYSSKDEARAAYEAKLGSGSIVPDKLTLVDRLRGKTTEEVIRERTREALLEAIDNIERLQWRFFQGSTPGAIRKAMELGWREDEALVQARHLIYVQRKIIDIETACKSIIRENPQAFKSEVAEEPYFMNANYGVESARVLKPGYDSELHEQLRPLVEELVVAKMKQESTRSKLESGFLNMLHSLMEEEELSKVKEAKVSPETQKLVGDALGGTYSQSELDAETFAKLERERVERVKEELAFEKGELALDQVKGFREN